MNTSNKIVGLAGTFASGKDTLAHYLVKEYNYLHVSTGDMVRQEALKERGSIERPVLHEVADNLRRTHGAGVMVDLAVKTFEEKRANHDHYDGLVVSGLRSLGEAKAVKAAGGMLVFVDAPIETRYERMVGRKRDDETKLTLDEFREQEATEMESSGEGDEAFNMRGIQQMSDVQLSNDADLDSFIAKSKQALGLQ